MRDTSAVAWPQGVKGSETRISNSTDVMCNVCYISSSLAAVPARVRNKSQQQCDMLHVMRATSAVTWQQYLRESQEQCTISDEMYAR